MNYDSSMRSWKPWWWIMYDLIFSMRGIYINSNLNSLSKFTSSSRSTEFKHFSNDHKDHPNQHENSHKLCDEMQHLFWIWWKLNGNRNNNISEFPNGGKAIVEQILVSEERNKSKRAELWESQSRFRVGKLTIWVTSFEIENYNRVHQVHQFHQNR